MQDEGSNDRLALDGALTLGEVDRLAAELPAPGAGRVVVDVSGATRMDTAGAWLIVDYRRRMQEAGGELALRGTTPPQDLLLKTVEASYHPLVAPQPAPHGARVRLEALGETVAGMAKAGLDLVAFLGQVIATLVLTTLRPARLRLTSLVHHMGEVGLSAVPIVSLMAFLIGIVLAFQGATQLRQFGAEVFVVDLIAVSVLRELGILLTAIIVAGRTGAAYTAAIGSMKMREEIDAMRTLGLDPIEVLVLPRVIALLLMLPVLGFIADIMGLLGGALMSWLDLGISPGLFSARLSETIDVWHYAVGIIKAPVFAMIIGVVGCFQGMQVGGNAESLGRRTSTSVVVSIFLVIVADAMFSIFFSVVGV